MSTYFTGYIVLQGFCKGRNVAVNVSAQNNNRYKNEKKVLCLSFVVEIKREPERNHLRCVTVKTDYSEISSVKMELHRDIEEFQRTPAYAGADLRGSRHVSLRRVPWTRTPPSPAIDALYHVLHTHYFALHGDYRRTNQQLWVWVLILFI